MKSSQIKWVDGIGMSLFCVFTFMASMVEFASTRNAFGLVLLGISVVAGMIAVKNFGKKSRKT